MLDRRLLSTVTVCMLLGACGGGSGGSTPPPTTTETINGITVPLEPSAALRDASLAGVDSNANGVRDEVERLLAGTTRSQMFSGPTLAIASEYHKLTTQILSVADTVSSYRRIACQDRLRTQTDKLVMPAEDIRDNTANTAERRQRLNANDKAAANDITQIEGDFQC